jgi:glycine dehydrogenase subunit 1
MEEMKAHRRTSARMDYVPFTSKQTEQMLRAIGAESIDDLFRAIPPEARLNRPLDLPPALDELTLRRHLSELAGANRPATQCRCFLGAGAYDHFIPAVVDALANQPGFLTAPAPFQPEASQGTLQALFEFQTMICQLTGMEVANASLYDGAAALVEAVRLAIHVTGKPEVLVSQGVHPLLRQALHTAVADTAWSCREIPLKNGILDTQELESDLGEETAAIVCQSPNFLGHIERVDTITKFAHANQSLMIQVFNPLSLGLLKHPGETGVDVAIGEGQPLGIPLSFGGPSLGLFATRNEYLRKIPGRLVGETVDQEGRRAFCLTLQTREPHARREKAASNASTNSAHNALRAVMYLAAIGPEGLRQISQLCYDKTCYLAERLDAGGVKRAFEQPFFNEILVRLNQPVEQVIADGAARGILVGYPVERYYPELKDFLLIAVTEKRTRAEIDELVDLLSASNAKEKALAGKAPLVASHAAE